MDRRGDAGEERRTEPPWVEGAVWWQVYPLGFAGADTTGADRRPTGALRRITRWLDYACGLGASGIALGPIFESMTHGYDTVDHLRIDARLGTDDDFAELVSAAHARGLRVLLDGVFNHVGRAHPQFRRALADGPDSDAARWFHLTWPEDGAEPSYHAFEGHEQLVTLNHANNDVVRYVSEVMQHWLARGADGWRLDAAYAVPRSFWAKVTAQVKAAFAQAYLVGEVIHGDYAEIVTEAGLDSVTQYELWKAIWSSLNDSNFFELAWALERHDAMLETFVPLTFVGNHDVTRIATRLTDERHVPHAIAILATIGGTPSIYAGDEHGLRGLKEDRVGGDDAIRPEFPDSPREWLAQGSIGYRWHAELFGLRRRNPWLHRARTSIVELANELIVYRVAAAGQCLTVALNTSDGPARFGALSGVVLAGDPGATRGSLPAHGWAVIDES